MFSIFFSPERKSPLRGLSYTQRTKTFPLRMKHQTCCRRTAVWQSAFLLTLFILPSPTARHYLLNLMWRFTRPID